MCQRDKRVDGCVYTGRGFKGVVGSSGVKETISQPINEGYTLLPCPCQVERERERERRGRSSSSSFLLVLRGGEGELRLDIR